MVLTVTRMARSRRRDALPVINEPCFGDHSGLLSSEDQDLSDNTNQEPSLNKLLLMPPSASLEQPCTCSVERYKLTVVGDAECGKTSLLNALVKSDFEAEESAIFDECVTDISTGDSSLEFMLCDCSGLENYESIRRCMFDGTDVFLLCFDIGNPVSLQSIVDKWVTEIKEECPGAPYLLVGCKNDLRTDSALQFCLKLPGDSKTTEPDSVGRLKAMSCSQFIGAKEYVECCAKTRWNIKQVFKEAADAIASSKEEFAGLATKPPSMLRRFSRFARRGSATDADCATSTHAQLSNPSPRRLSLFSTG